MHLLSLDLELNQPSQRVIQVGACILDTNKKQIIDELSIFVDPREPLLERIIDLTGITEQDVQTGVSCREAFFLLKNFHKKHRCFMNPLVWGSGTYNDSHHLYMQACPGETNFMGFRVIDVKTISQSVFMRQNKMIKGGLARSMERLGLRFIGREHNALDDAKNTAMFWSFLMDKISAASY